MSRGSATLITSKGFPSCHLSCPGSSARPPDLPIALLARCSCAWVGREVAQPQDLGLWVNPLLPLLRLRPCPPPAASLSGVCALLSFLGDTPALPSPPFSSALFAAVSRLPLGARERQLEEEQGRRERARRSRGGVGGERARRVWTGSHSAAGRRRPGPSRALE